MAGEDDKPVTNPEARAITLPPTARSATEGRRFLLDTLVMWGLDTLIDAAALVTTEVITNAVLHARTPLTLTIRRDGDGGVRIGVKDGSTHPPQRRQPDTTSTSGRGVDLLDRLATSWSVDMTESGKTVHFRLDSHTDPWALSDRDWLDEGGL
jgi:anti-sigma regulatory factor (Ser/Thr protein kinase)